MAKKRAVSKKSVEEQQVREMLSNMFDKIADSINYSVNDDVAGADLVMHLSKKRLNVLSHAPTAEVWQSATPYVIANEQKTLKSTDAGAAKSAFNAVAHVDCDVDGKPATPSQCLQIMITALAGKAMPSQIQLMAGQALNLVEDEVLKQYLGEDIAQAIRECASAYVRLVNALYTRKEGVETRKTGRRVSI